LALQWTTALSVGVPEIDAQHRELFARIDRLHDAVLHRDRQEAVRLLGFLREYAVVHFAAEERLMEQAGYLDMARHVAEHRRFTATLREIDVHYRQAGASAELVFRLEQQAVAWLRDHVYFTDVALGRWVLASHTADARMA
jgi:hemerythrin